MTNLNLLSKEAVKLPDTTVKAEGNEPFIVPVTVMTPVEVFKEKYAVAVIFP